MLLLGTKAHAACHPDGRITTCVTARGAAGTRECINGRFTNCQADFEGKPEESCTTGCGTEGRIINGTCRAAEVCNSCDDDGDGLVDEDLKCAIWPLEPRCPVGNVTIGANKLTSTELIGDRSSDLLTSGAANLNGAHLPADTVLSPATIAWSFAPPDCAKSTTVTFTGVQLNDTSTIRAESVTTGATSGSISGGIAAPQTQSITLPREEHVFVAAMAGPTRTRDGFRLSAFETTPMNLSTPPLRHQLNVRRWTYGVLLQAGDTQFFELLPDESQRDVIVWVEAGTDKGPTADVDLFIGLDRDPSLDAHDFSSRGTSTGEAIRVPGGSRRTIVAAVQAWSGAAWFRIHAARFEPKNEYPTLSAGFTFMPDASDVTTAANTLRVARRQFFGATLGRRWIGKVSLTAPNKPDACQYIDLCFRGIDGTS